MKKTTILAVSVVLAVAVVAVWFVREQKTSSDPSPHQTAGNQSLVDGDEHRIEPSTIATLPPELPTAPADAFTAPHSTSGPTPLFAEPSELGVEYANAADQIPELREAAEPLQISWNRLFEPDLAAMSRFFQEATLRPDGFSELFSLDMFPAYQPCVISSVNRVRQLDEPEMYRIYTSCNNGGSPLEITALYDARKSTFSAVLSNQDVHLQIGGLNDSKLAWAFEIDRSSHPDPVSDR